MNRYFIFIVFAVYINAFAVMNDDIYKLSDLKYKGYDILKRKISYNRFS